MIVVCTAHSPNYQEMADVTLPTVERYCKRHGYNLFYDGLRDPREGDAMKITLFKGLYETGQFTGDDWFMWIDTDALVMNGGFSVAEMLSLSQVHYVVGYDFNGMNTGVWFARFTSHAHHFLSVAQNVSIAMGWADQVGLIQTALSPPFNTWVALVPAKAFNAYPYELYGWDHYAHKNEINNYEPGDFILHLPGIEYERRLELLREYAKEAK